MTVYGNECGSAGFILLNNGFVIGEYTVPQDITIVDLGLPYYTVREVILSGGVTTYTTESRDGGGNFIAVEVAAAKTPTPVTFTPPATEAGNWTVTSPNIEYWNGSGWAFYAGQSYQRTIYRYRVTIVPA